MESSFQPRVQVQLERAQLITYKGYDQLTQWLSVDPTDGFTPFARFSDPFPNGGPLLPPGNSLGALNDVGFEAGGNVKSITDTPYEQSWSFGFETELPKDIVLDLNYVGKKGTHLYFSGASELNHLPISVESLSPSEIGNLLITDQNNPFFGIITDPNSELSGETVSAFSGNASLSSVHFARRRYLPDCGLHLPRPPGTGRKKLTRMVCSFSSLTRGLSLSTTHLRPMTA
jgi:hypothetical protein